MPPKEKEESVFVLDAKTKEDDKLVCEKGSYYNQEKWLKDDKDNGVSVSFLGREAAKRATKSREVPCHIKIRQRTFFESLL